MRAHRALPSGAIQQARRLRRDATDAERLLWRALREKLPEPKWRRQVPFGPYTADFASHSAKLIVEVDGGQHAEQLGHDAARTRFLEGEGYRVIRFWNNDVMTNLEGVLRIILSRLPSPLVGEGGPKGRMRGARRRRAPALRAGTPHPLPSPTRGEGESVKSSDLESV